jgi:Peptidase A4 family
MHIMETQDLLCRAACRGLVAAGLLAVGYASAEAQSVVGQTPTHVHGISLIAPPPAGFDPTTATTGVNARFALPPAPDGVAAPRAYAAWQSAVNAVQNREMPVLTATNISHGPIKGKKRSSAQGSESVEGTKNLDKVKNNIINATSSNWSGTSIIDGTTSNVEAIIGMFVVPTAHQAFGECTGDWDYSSLWPGIDGNGGAGGSDVLQAGVEVDAYCSGGNTSGFYSAWIEWFPNNSIRVSSPAINPGDLVFVEVWSTSPTQGYAYFYNYSTNVTAEYALTAPAGTTLHGSSLEWIVERPSLGTSLTTLTNYIASPWSEGVAWDYADANPTYYYMGNNPTVGTLEQLTMNDNGGNGISSAAIESFNFLWFQNFGSACGQSAPPC